MEQRSEYNPSLRMPIIDIVVTIVLMVVTAFFWFHTKGQAKLESAAEQLQRSRQENAAELQKSKDALADVEQELTDTRNLCKAKAQYVVFLKERIDVERETIEVCEKQNEQYTDAVLDLRTEITRGRDRRMAYNTDVFETGTKIEGERAEIANLEAQALERNDEIDRLDAWIAEAHQQLEENPPSRFPVRSALASAYMITDPGEVVFSFTLGVKEYGALDLGLIGSLGMGTDGASSVKQGGVFANLPISPHRASIDFEGGVSQFESRENNDSDTSPFASALIRLAPSAKERLFLIAGPHYSHEDLALRLGLALGRR